MVLRKSTKERLEKAIRAFKLENLYKHVLREFKQVLPEDIANIVSQNHLQVSKRQIVRVFLKLLLSKDLNNEDCEKSIVFLQTQAVVLRPENRQWIALRLHGEPDNYGFSESYVESLVFRSLRRANIETITRAVHQSSAFWINITVKKITRKGLVLQPPTFCIFYVDHPYLFISKRNDANFEKALVEAFGFVDHSPLKLTGRDPRSMLEILATRENRLEVVKPVNIRSEPLETTFGLDFSQYHERKKYMNELFTSDAPKLFDYSVECREAPWHANTKFPKMSECTYPMSLHYRTKDTIGMFKVLAEEGLLEVPVPTYVSRALKCARNKVRVRANRNASVIDQSAA